MANVQLHDALAKDREALAAPVAVAAQTEDPNVFDIDEYKALVRELGVNDSAIRNYEFRQFLNEQGIQVYPYEKVATFLDNKIKKEAPNRNLVWAWKPLNESYPAAPRDRAGLQISISAISAAFGRAAERSFVTPSFSGSITVGEPNPLHQSRAYARAIPQAVLMTVKKLKDKFGDAVQFYASDYEVRDPDPFLMVTGPGLDYYVIERWDEPMFRS